MSIGSIRFAYDPETGIRTAKYHGVVTDQILVDAYRGLITSPEFVPLAHDLADLDGIERIELTPNGLRELGEMLSVPPGSVRPPAVPGLAIVASSPASFGLARMYELMTETALPKETRVFRELGEAHAWLATLPRLV
jgi:hypothetical protein